MFDRIVSVLRIFFFFFYGKRDRSFHYLRRKKERKKERKSRLIGRFAEKEVVISVNRNEGSKGSGEKIAGISFQLGAPLRNNGTSAIVNVA